MTRTLFIAAAFLLTAGAAAAESEQSAPQAKFSYADLNLATSEGVNALYSRIQTASRKVCASYQEDNQRDLGAVAGYKSCQRDAIARAVSQMNLAPLTQMATGVSAPITVASH